MIRDQENDKNLDTRVQREADDSGNENRDQEDDQNLYTRVQRETDDVENSDPLQNMSTDMLAKFRHQIKEKMNRNKNRSAQIGRVTHKYNLRRRN
jgi:hypothetical protein